MSLEDGDLGPCCRIPQARGLVLRCRHHARPVRRESCEPDNILMSFEYGDPDPCFCVPQARGAVPRCRHHARPVRRESCGPDSTLVPLEDGDPGSCCRIPQARCAGHRKHARSVGREGCGPDIVFISRQQSALALLQEGRSKALNGTPERGPVFIAGSWPSGQCKLHGLKRRSFRERHP